MLRVRQRPEMNSSIQYLSLVIHGGGVPWHSLDGCFLELLDLSV